MGDDGEMCYAERHYVPDKTYLTLMIVLPTIICIGLCIGSGYFFPYMTDNRGMQFGRAKMLFSISALLIAMFGCYSYGVQKFVYPCTTVSIWFNGEDGVNIWNVIIGMGANTMFGFIDNAGLFFGGCYLDEVFELLPGSKDANVCAGYGNTFSDFLGAFLGTFCGKILEDSTGIDVYPLWAEAIGIIFGCLLGIAIPKAIVGSSSTQGLNKISSKAVFLGTMEEDELECLINGTKTLFDFRSERIFKKLDVDGSGGLDKEEIKAYLKTAMGEDWNEDEFEDEYKGTFNVTLDDNDDQTNMEEWKIIYRKMAQKIYDEQYKPKDDNKDQKKVVKIKDKDEDGRVDPIIQNRDQSSYEKVDQEKNQITN